jgi:hypothetical protein
VLITLIREIQYLLLIECPSSNETVYFHSLIACAYVQTRLRSTLATLMMDRRHLSLCDL